MHEKKRDEHGHNEVGVHDLDQLSKVEAMTFVPGLEVAACGILRRRPCHDEEVEGKVDVLLDNEEADDSGSESIHTVGELHIDSDLVS